MNPKKCLILYNAPTDNALADELDVLHQVDWVSQHLKKLGISVDTMAISDHFFQQIQPLPIHFDGFIFNLIESINNHGELNYFTPALLSMYRLPYTGSSFEALFVTSGKMLSKQMMQLSGIKVPAGFYPDEAEKLEIGKTYILKPIWQDGSLDLDEESVFVAGKQGNLLEGKSRSYWFIEEFVRGREFNVSVIKGSNGPDILPPAEIVFKNWSPEKPKIVGYKAKWNEESFEYKNTVREFPCLNDDLKKKLESISVMCWKLFGLGGYARVDFRVTDDNTPYVLEVNANPCISPDSGFVAAVQQKGYDFTKVIEHIINDLNGF